jgi:hypothetical protein
VASLHRLHDHHTVLAQRLMIVAPVERHDLN